MTSPFDVHIFLGYFSLKVLLSPHPYSKGSQSSKDSGLHMTVLAFMISQSSADVGLRKQNFYRFMRNQVTFFESRAYNFWFILAIASGR
jgi:hypothetical protein